MNAIRLYTGAELASMLIPGAAEWMLKHVAGALDASAAWHADRGWNARLDRTDVVLEVRDTNLMRDVRESIIGRLEQATFLCEWILPEHRAGKAGFLVALGTGAVRNRALRFRAPRPAALSQDVSGTTAEVPACSW